MSNVSAPDRDRWLALAGIGTASFLGCIDFTIVNTAMPAIQQDFGAGVEQAQWIVSVFVMALSAFMVAAGRLADLRGRRRALYTGMLVFAAASLGAGLAGSIGSLIAWRLMQGLSCAALYTSSAALVAEAFPAQQRGKALGLLFAGNGLGLALGPVAGGLLVGALGWRSVFLLNVPLIALAFALCLRRVRESCAAAEPGETLDLVGLLLLVAALPCLLLAIGAGDRWGWTSAPTMLLALAGLLLLVLFVRVERRVRAPLLDLALFANRRFLAASGASFSLAFFYCAAFFLMPLYLDLARAQGSAAIGWLLLPTTALMALVSPLAGRWADRHGTAALLAGGFAFLALSALLQTRFDASSDWAGVLIAFACMGIGWGAILGPSTVAALAAVPAPQGGVAMGAASTLHNLGAALGLTIASVVYRLAAGPQPDVTGFLAGFRAAMWLLFAVALATMLALGLFGRRVAASGRAQSAGS